MAEYLQVAFLFVSREIIVVSVSTGRESVGCPFDRVGANNKSNKFLCMLSLPPVATRPERDDLLSLFVNMRFRT